MTDPDPYKGRKGRLRVDGLSVAIVALASRYAYGRTDILVAPSEGTGTRWVQEGSIEWKEE